MHRERLTRQIALSSSTIFIPVVNLGRHTRKNVIRREIQREKPG